MPESKLKYLNYDIVFQEVPNEISLAINITGCPHQCPNCHSQFLWDDVGEVLEDDIQNILSKYVGLITCVCFMGGDHNIHNLIEQLHISKEFGLKTCLYSGANDISIISSAIPFLDYIKIGSFVNELGGLNSESTNQRFYRNDNGILCDITNIFWRKYNEPTLEKRES